MSPPSWEEVFELVARLCAVLNEIDCAYHLTGGIVVSHYGDPRFTQDVDLVIQLSNEQVEN